MPNRSVHGFDPVLSISIGTERRILFVVLDRSYALNIVHGLGHWMSLKFLRDLQMTLGALTAADVSYRRRLDKLRYELPSLWSNWGMIALNTAAERVHVIEVRHLVGQMIGVRYFIGQSITPEQHATKEHDGKHNRKQEYRVAHLDSSFHTSRWIKCSLAEAYGSHQSGHLQEHLRKPVFI
jgi:hypothetical protein